MKTFLMYLKRYPLALLAAISIAVLSLIPIPEVNPPVEVPLADKWVHMLMYGTLCCVIWWEYLRSHRQKNWLRIVFFAFLAPIVMGGALELAQRYLTTCRSGEWLDFVANSIGVLLATIVGLAFCWFAKGKK